MDPKKANKFAFFSFLPALAFWYLEENYPLKVALTGGLALAVLEIAIERIWLGHVHKISKFNFVLILLLGGISLLGDSGIWFKLQPCFTGVFMGGFLIFALIRGEGMLGQMMKEMNPELPMPASLLRSFEWHTGVFMFIYGSFMGTVAFWGTTDQWLFFKTLGFYICFAVFAVVEIYFIRRKMRKLISENNSRRL